MKRSRIVTQTKELVEPKNENKLGVLEKPSGKVSEVLVEELVAVSAKVLESQNVVNAQGERLGKLEDLMIDLNKGCIAYAVLSFGGILGMGNKLFAIPWEVFCLQNQWNYKDSYRQQIVFNVSRDKLEKAPGFDKARWPREPDRNWLKEVFEFYGCKPYWAPAEEANKPQPPPG